MPRWWLWKQVFQAIVPALGVLPGVDIMSSWPTVLEEVDRLKPQPDQGIWVLNFNTMMMGRISGVFSKAGDIKVQRVNSKVENILHKVGRHTPTPIKSSLGFSQQLDLQETTMIHYSLKSWVMHWHLLRLWSVSRKAFSFHHTKIKMWWKFPTKHPN